MNIAESRGYRHCPQSTTAANLDVQVNKLLIIVEGDGFVPQKNDQPAATAAVTKSGRTAGSVILEAFLCSYFSSCGVVFSPGLVVVGCLNPGSGLHHTLTMHMHSAGHPQARSQAASHIPSQNR